MFVSLSQIATSLGRLGKLHPFFGYAFFGFKLADIPVGRVAPFSYQYIRDFVLEPYFKLARGSSRYFNPFSSTSQWVSNRYESTSLQRVVADTFGRAFIHEKGESFWGWEPDYVSVLEDLIGQGRSSKIGLLDMAVWLFRNDGEIPEGDAADYLVQAIVDKFRITPEEVDRICLTSDRFQPVDLQSLPVIDDEILSYVGWPDDVSEKAGARLSLLALLGVGPTDLLEYEPASRLNVIAGDNSLGKSFILDCAWWAITGDWIGYPAEPKPKSELTPEIDYKLTSASNREREYVCPYNPIDLSWQRGLEPIEGLGLYATYTGSVAVWDSASSERPPGQYGAPASMMLSRDAIWNGFEIPEVGGRVRHISNGLIRDWASWQGGDVRYSSILEAFESAIEHLSPPGGPALRRGRPTRLANDSREMPTLRQPYGEVPVVFSSAGVQRILGLAYMLVWHWFEHKTRVARLGREPARQMIVLLDEVEAHLHPRWQRQILPSILTVMGELAPEVAVQLHIATHSPLVLASIEPHFNENTDCLHLLKPHDASVELGKVPFHRQGTADGWLQSDLFGFQSARSIEAERAIEDAKRLQAAKSHNKNSLRRAHERLVNLLADDDEFWVRWLFFYEKQVSNP